jgi:hypothetical protein
MAIISDKKEFYKVGRGVPQACRIQVYENNGLMVAISSELPEGPSCDMPAPAAIFFDSTVATVQGRSTDLVWLSHFPFQITNRDGLTLVGPENKFIVTRIGGSDLAQDQLIDQQKAEAMIGVLWTLDTE